MAGLVVGGGSTPVAAWPAIQDAAGLVYPCDTRPAQLPDGRWTCRSAGVLPSGALVEVVRPGLPPGARPEVPPYRYGFSPWGRPPSEPSGYDALDPWLGGGGPSQR